MSKRINENGMKQDRFRHSKFDQNVETSYAYFQGVTQKTANTIGGAWEHNGGRRSAESTQTHWDESPFEDGELSSNWRNREGWDQFYSVDRKKDNLLH